MKIKRKIAVILMICMVFGSYPDTGMFPSLFPVSEVYGATADQTAEPQESTEEEADPAKTIAPTEDAADPAENTETVENTETSTEESTESVTSTEEGTESAEEVFGMQQSKLLQNNVLSSEDLNMIPMSLPEDDEVTVNIPASLDELHDSGEYTFNINSNQDWLNLCRLSKQDTLAGYTFLISMNTEANIDPTEIRDRYYFSRVSDDNGSFDGIGSEEFPFKGTLKDSVMTGTNLYTNVPLFAYLSTEATLSDLNIYTEDCSAGLAEHLMVGAKKTTLMNFSQIKIMPEEITNADGTKTVKNIRSTSAAGGLFADVIYDSGVSTLTLQGAGISVTSDVSGVTAGGLIGQLNGGTVSLVLDGGITWAPYTYPLSGNTTDSKSVGGWIGELNGTTLNISAGTAAGITFNQKAGVSAESAAADAKGYWGGLFGRIYNSTVTVSSPVTYTGHMQGQSNYTAVGGSYDICGENAGIFAGSIENSVITLNKAFTSDSVRLGKRTGAAGKGIGGFAGTVTDSSVTAAGSGGVSFKGTFVGSMDSAAYNFGGLAGYAKDSTFRFTKESPCKISDFISFYTSGSTYYTYGYVAAAIGKYEEDGNLQNSTIMQYVSIEGTSTKIAGYNGNAAGLVAYLELKDATVDISNCSVQSIQYLTNNYASMGVASVKNTGGNGKLTLNHIVCNGSATGQKYNASVFGGLIGYADSDFAVNGSTTGNVFSTALNYQLLGTSPNYFGALAGSVNNATPDVSGYREADISNVLIGNTYSANLTIAGTANGGIIGTIGTGTSVCLDGKLYLNGGNAQGFLDTAAFSVEPQQARMSSSSTSYKGMIAGMVNNSLVYLQPTAELQLSKKYLCNEIGNYGGVIRNGNWDADVNTINADIDNGVNTTVLSGDENTWIIQNHQVTAGIFDNNSGSYDLDTYGDFIRFAVAMNTCGGFLPKDAAGTAKAAFTDIQTGTYTLPEGTTFHLDRTGIMCLGRNDSITNVNNYPFKGSFIGESADKKTTLIYNITSYRQPYIGLFPKVLGTDAGISFQNLNLEYTLSYQTERYNIISSTSYSSGYSAYTENAGGLAACAEGNIAVSDVAYNGTMNDMSNTNTEYMGGIFGQYTGAASKTLKIENLTAKMKFSHYGYNHIWGGVIAYVNQGTGTKTSTSDTRCRIQVEHVTLSGDITALYGSTNARYSLRESAFITKIGTTETVSNYTNNCDLSVTDVTVTDMSLGRSSVTSAASTSYQYLAMGGFLGYSWINAEASLTDIYVGESGQGRNYMTGQALFGGLLYQANGKMTIDGLTVQNTTINPLNNEYFANNNKNAAGVNCGLLIRDGRYLYLGISDYNVVYDPGDTGNNVIVENYKGTYFDEIVGITKIFDSNDNYNYTGGIVSINDTADDVKHLQTGTDYSSYSKGTAVTSDGSTLLVKTNPNTRYYYDLNKISFDTTVLADLENLDSPEKVMVWHVLHYASSTILKCLIGDGVNFTLPTDYTIDGSIDLEGYSIYPTAITRTENYEGVNDATILFHADDIIEGEKETNTNPLYPDIKVSQHYQMHAGLFGNVTGTLTVEDLNLGGNYSRSEGYAGAMVADTITGTVDFNHIELENLWCESSDNWNTYPFTEAPIGLMVAKIYNTNTAKTVNVTFHDVSMTGYGSYTGADKAASALIGQVGDPAATDADKAAAINIKLRFTQMGITDDNSGGSVGMNTARLAAASLIYSYNYKENCTAIYTFTYDDYRNGKDQSAQSNITNRVTIGQELEAETKDDGSTAGYDKIEYFDIDYAVGLNDQGSVIDPDYDSGDYLPYVYEVKSRRKIIVNPKVAPLTTGCGTYEDPYVIESDRQIITLYRYLYEESDFEDMLKMNGLEWKVNTPGTDAGFCDGSDSSHTQLTYGTDVGQSVDTSENNAFKNQLSQAYYQITDDIDMSEYDEFLGFGESARPFIGVFAGKEMASGAYPTITMPDQGDFPITQFGWIRNAKGVVVKDLTIQFHSNININNKLYTNGNVAQYATAGGVIAAVWGGENIIDNVTVTNSADDNYCYTAKTSSVTIGGYVGSVELGGVILRNMDTDSLGSFSVGYPENATASDYLYVCGVIGRVKDGYVIYDGTQGMDTALMLDVTAAGTNDCPYYNNPLAASRSYDIVNGAYLKEHKGDNDANAAPGIQWTEGSGYKAANDVQLEVLSMALNSGMLNYDSKSTAGVGYCSLSRQRNGNYDYIGKVDQTASPDSYTAYRDVIQNDNDNGSSTLYYDSYLMQFFSGISDAQRSNILNSSSPDTSVLNPVVNANSSDILTYRLTTEFDSANPDTTAYDLGRYGTAFRGFGARYNRNLNNIFQSHMTGPDGNDVQAKIRLDMEVNNVQNTTRAALCNEIPATGKTLEFTNLILEGKVSSTYANNSATYNAAGFTSQCASSMQFSNVDLNGLSVEGYGYLGGYIGYAATGTGFTFEGTDLESVKILQTVSNSSTSSTYYYNRGVGGLIGTLDSSSAGVKITGTADQTVKINEVTVESAGYYPRIGGLVGYSNAAQNEVENVTLTNLKVMATRMDSNVGPNNFSAYASYYVAAGGILGYCSGNMVFDHVKLGSTDINESRQVVIEQASSYYMNINNGVGGFVGRMGNSSKTITVSDCQILGAESGDAWTTRISGGASVGGVTSNCYAATVQRGDTTKAASDDNFGLKIDGISVEGARYAGGFCGEISGSAGAGISLADATVKNSHFAMRAKWAYTSTLSSYYTYGYSGDIGGFIGYCTIPVATFTDCSVSGIAIDADYTGRVGGWIGYGNNAVTINNADSAGYGTTDSIICGVTAGGIFGQYAGSNASVDNLSVSGNTIVSGNVTGKQKPVVANVYTPIYRAGGFAGYLSNTGSTAKVYVNTLDAEDNRIATDKNITAYSPYIGGVVGESAQNTYFYHTVLKDNYIGALDLSTTAGATSADRRTYFRSTSTDTIKENLYVKNTDSGTWELEKTALASVSEGDFYQYALYQGAVSGGVSDSVVGGITVHSTAENTFVDLNIQYTDNTYRPVSDVGMTAAVGTADDPLDSDEEMYAAYRRNYFLVYDGMEQEITTDTERPAWITSSVVSGKDHYSFANLEEIWKNYTGTLTDKRYAYRFSENYLGGENSQKISLSTVYGQTYKKEKAANGTGDADKPDTVLVYNGSVIPMIYYQSAEAGSVDEVIQSYINMLTNNSGALNSYDNQPIKVTAHRMELNGTTISEKTGETASIRYDETKKEFGSGKDGTRSVYDTWLGEDNASFTLLEINYMDVSQADEVVWTLYIPIYVEQRLEITSNIRLLDGLEYNVDTVITDGTYRYPDVTDPSNAEGSGTYIALDTGSNYSLYVEYIYNEVRENYPYQIPKQLVMSSNNDVSFHEGILITLIDLEDNNKAYYYEVGENDGSKILFDQFKDSAGNPFECRLANDSNWENHENYKSIVTGDEFENVAVERYLLLVNRSVIADTLSEEGEYYSYQLYVRADELNNPDNQKYYNKTVYNRLDFLENSWGDVAETPGVNCTQESASVDSDSVLSASGQVAMQLEYKLTVDPVYWSLNHEKPEYLDIATYLTLGADGEKVALPQGTQVFFEKPATDAAGNTLTDSSGNIIFERESAVYVVYGQGISTVYYYGNCESNGDLDCDRDDDAYGKFDVMEMSMKNWAAIKDYRVIFDFSQVDSATFPFDPNEEYYVHADVVAFGEGEQPVDGETLVTFSQYVNTRVVSNIGFALNIDELMELGMNQYLPGETDAGIITYTTDIEFPEGYITQSANRKDRYYTILYTLEEKDQFGSGSDAPSYHTFYNTNQEISLYLGTGQNRAADPIVTGQPVTYKITPEMIESGAVFGADNLAYTTESATPGVIRMPCTLIAERDNLACSNYRIHAYLLITDAQPTQAEIDSMNLSGTTDLLNDYYVFTVAKVKTDME